MPDIYDDMKPRDIAMATAAAIRILVEYLPSDAAARQKIDEAFRTKAGQLIGQLYEDNAANLLRLMGGVVQPK